MARHIDTALLRQRLTDEYARIGEEAMKHVSGPNDAPYVKSQLRLSALTVEAAVAEAEAKNNCVDPAVFAGALGVALGSIYINVMLSSPPEAKLEFISRFAGIVNNGPPQQSIVGAAIIDEGVEGGHA